MDLSKWSILLVKKLFESSSNGSNILLHIAMSDIVQYAKEEDVEIVPGKYAAEFSDDAIRNDFVSKFCPRQDGRPTPGTIDQFKSIIQRIIKGNETTNLIPLVTILIMPLCENETDLDENKYYKTLYNFLTKYHFIRENRDEKIRFERDKTFLSNIDLGNIWSRIDNWANDIGYNYHSKLSIRTDGGRLYVRSIINECVITRAQQRKMGLLFDKSGFSPNQNLSSEEIWSAFSNHYDMLGINQNKFKTIQKDYREVVTDILVGEYRRWEGETSVKEKNRNGIRRETELSSGISNPLFLCMDFDNLENKPRSFSLWLYSSVIESREDMTFIHKDNGVEIQLNDVYISYDGYANRVFDNTRYNLAQILQERGNNYVIEEKGNTGNKARFRTTDFYLLKFFRGHHVSTTEYNKDQIYFFLVRNDILNDYADWLSMNSSEEIIIDGDPIGEMYKLYKIRAQSPLPNNTTLSFNEKIILESYNNIVVKDENEPDEILLSDLVPAQFKILGIDSNKKVYAVSTEESIKRICPRVKLNYDEDNQIWTLPVFSNKFQRNCSFELFIDTERIPHSKKYKFTNFSLPTEIKTIRLNKWGEICESDDDSIANGLRLNIANDNHVNWTYIDQLKRKANAKTINAANYENTDYLLYAITTASYCKDYKRNDKDWVETIIKRVCQMNSQNGFECREYNFSQIMSEYFKMGYINMAFEDRRYIIAANRPTLILMVPFVEYEIKEQKGRYTTISLKTVRAGDGRYKCMLSGGRTPDLIKQILDNQRCRRLKYECEILRQENPLIPSTIFIYADDRNAFTNLSNECNLDYQEIIYSEALLNNMPSVDDYIRHVLNDPNTETDYSGNSHYRSIDYLRMAQLFNIRNMQRSIRNVEIDKDDIDTEKDIVTYNPESRYEESTVMYYHNRMFEVDKYWGHFVGMKFRNAKVLIHDATNNTINLPNQVRLPLLYSRALTLIKGKTPTSTYGGIAYDLVANPTAEACKPQSILKKLGQN